MKISVIGAGSWGTALAALLQSNGHQVILWSIIKEEVALLNEHREHVDKLPGVKLDAGMLITNDLKEALDTYDLMVLAVPATFVRSTAALVKPYVNANSIIVNVAKGIEDATLMTLDQVLKDVLGACQIAVLSGPSHAEEVGRKIPTSVVVASDSDSVVKIVQDAFMNTVFRVYGSNDVLGVELGGALKNVIALAAGISDGLGYGDNTKAALMTRGMVEIGKLGMALGATQESFMGLSGMGDLIVTCTSVHSRNRRAGILIGEGKTLDEALDTVKMVVEGVYSAKAAYTLSKQKEVEMPIIEAVYEVLFEDKDPRVAVSELMTRDKKFE